MSNHKNEIAASSLCELILETYENPTVRNLRRSIAAVKAASSEIITDTERADLIEEFEANLDLVKSVGCVSWDGLFDAGEIAKEIERRACLIEVVQSIETAEEVKASGHEVNWIFNADLEDMEPGTVVRVTRQITKVGTYISAVQVVQQQ